MDTKKEALIITTISGFLQQFEMEQVRILQREGYHIHYASNFNKQIYECDVRALEKIGVEIHHVEIRKKPLHLFHNLRALRDIIQIIDRENIQIIHCHNPVGGVIGRLAGKYCHVKKPIVIYTAHGFHFYKEASPITWIFFYGVERFFAQYTDYIVVINKEDYKYASSFRLKKGGRICYIPGTGIDTTKYEVASSDERLNARNQLSLGENQFFLLSVGELNRNKNHMAVIRALGILKRRGIEERTIHYGICGTGPYDKKLVKQIKKENLEKYVTLYGYSTNIRNYYAAADGFIFPSVREGLGMACLEAMSMGIPVITSDNRGTREYMTSGETGIICEAHDEAAFADAIESMINMSAEERQRISDNCRSVVQEFNISKTIQIMEQLYKEVIASVERS